MSSRYNKLCKKINPFFDRVKFSVPLQLIVEQETLSTQISYNN